MMLSLPKEFKTPQTNQISTELPQHIIFACILPRLSYKLLSKFKCVSKKWYKIISADAKFAQYQSLFPSPISCGAIFSGLYGNKVKLFSTFDSPIGFNPCKHHHLFSNRYVQCKTVLASSGGLLCILFKYVGFSNFSHHNRSYLYVGNLATGKGEVIPLPNQARDYKYNIGLAFDPLIESDCYQLVSLHRLSNAHEVEYEFDVYSTKTCKWVKSKQSIKGIKSVHAHGKPITMKNVIFWDCYEYIISFDPWNDVASYIELPKHDDLLSYNQELGTCNGRITCTRLDCRSVEVYMLNKSENVWELKHKVNSDMMIDLYQDIILKFWRSLGKTLDQIGTYLFWVCHIKPFPYEGGNVLYYRISVEKAELVMSYDLKFGKVAKFSEFRLNDRSDVFESFDLFERFDRSVFSYHNSMVQVPICQASHYEGRRLLQ